MPAKNPEELNKDVEHLRDWLNKQPHLPKNLSDKLLARFLHSCYYDMEKTKKTMELFFTIRKSAPELLNNRDPKSAQMQKIFNILKLGQLEISGNRNLFIWQLNDPGLENYDYVSDARVFFISMDAWLLSEKDLEEEDLVILDVKDISLKFLTKFNMSVAKKMSRYQEEALPIRLKEIHIINAPSFIDKIFSLVKPFLNKDMSNMIHFHPPKSESIFKYFSKDELPEDFGGTRGTLSEQYKHVLDTIYEKREYFLDDTFWRATKDKKSKNKDYEEPEVASFKSLAID